MAIAFCCGFVYVATLVQVMGDLHSQIRVPSYSLYLLYWWRIGFFFLVMLSDLHFDILNFICHLQLHWVSLSRYSWRDWQSCGISTARYSRLSSANSLNVDVMFSPMSLMSIKNIRGPRTVPLGTPDRTLTSSMLAPSTITLRDLFMSHALIQPFTDPSIP